MIGSFTTRSVPHVVIDASHKGIRVSLAQLWEYRDLFWFLSLRDITIRYKQSFLGFFWVVLQPLALMLVLTVFFGLLGRTSPRNAFGTPIPFPLYYFSALLIWQYFDNALNKAMNSVSIGMITKIYFPRIILPTAGVFPGLVDLFFSLVVFGALFLWFRVFRDVHLALSAMNALWIPVLIMSAMMTALGVGTWFAALKIKYRDMNHIVPVITRIWFFASPVVYDSSRIPAEYRLLYGLNPMVGVIEGFRWALVHTAPPRFEILAASAIGSFVILVTGIYYFMRTEKYFADII